MDGEHKEGSCVIWCEITREQSQTSSWKASSKTRHITLRAKTHHTVWRHFRKLLEHSLHSSRVPSFSFLPPRIKLPLINYQCEYSLRAPKPLLVPFSLPPGSCSSVCNWCLKRDPMHTLQAILKHFSLLKKDPSVASEPMQTMSEQNNVSLS